VNSWFTLNGSSEERYREALQEIDRFRKKKPDKGNHLRTGILESRCLRSLGECDKALEAAQGVLGEGEELQGHAMTVIDALVEIADASLCLFQVDRAFDACQKAEQLVTELRTDDSLLMDSIRASILHVKSIAWYYKDDVQRGIECSQKGLSIRERLGDREGIVSSLMRIAYLHLEVDPSKTLEYHARALELNNGLGHKRPIIQALQSESLIRIREREWDEAEQLLLSSLSLAKENEWGGWIRSNLWCLAYLHHGKGDFQRAEEYYLECLALSEEVGADLLIALTSGNLGEIHRARGDLEKARECYERSMDINKKMGRTKGYLTGLANCGMVQYALGSPDKALTLLEESLALSEEQELQGLLGGKIRSYNILNIISILMEKGMANEAQERLEQLHQISEETLDTFDEQAHRIAAALVLKSSMLPKNRVRAKEFLTEVANGSFFDYEISALALLHLSELLVNELQMTGDEDTLGNIDTHLNSLQTMAPNQGSTLLLVETMMIQSKVSLLQLNVEETKRLLDEARGLAKQKGLQNISKRIAEEEEAVFNELKIWEELGENKPPMAERTGKIGIHEQIGGMIQQGLWRKMLF
jgi:tetratricopeptide (TPR) repeat protein